ncbi:hypothetical protein AVEN_145990-1 [Araneus ventricosus]|uniref:Uncharacterized protein n=1 Tax=Araneus ventricosus TaxID=182803 RepID=A0A4Y2HB47_ARAVE|nr:hypothetical protein AVEN_145990-1 [Araneus ventricosus]
MTKSELEEIVRCLSESKNQRLCDRFQICNMMMPQQVKTTLFKCERVIDPSGKRRCSEKEKLYSSRDVFSKIFDCISQNTSTFTAEESRQMMEFETCARSLYIGNCKLVARGKKEH